MHPLLRIAALAALCSVLLTVEARALGDQRTAEAVDSVVLTATTKKNKPVTINVRANDSDPAGDPLVVAAVSEAPHGTVTVNADSTVTYRPDNGYSGTDSFTYTASDGRGGRDTATDSIVVKHL